jgi:hypothetical protein
LVLVPLFYCLANYGQDEKYTVTGWGEVVHQVDNLFTKGRNIESSGEGVLPVAIILPAAALVLVAFSLVTRPPGHATLARFFSGRTVEVPARPAVDGQAGGKVPAPVRT